MTLFLCWDSEGTSESTDTVVEDLFHCVDEDSDAEGPPKDLSKVKDHKSSKKRKASSGSEKSQSEDECSSDESED